MRRWMGGAIGVLLVLVPPMPIHGPGWRPGDPPPFGTWRSALVEEAVDRGFDRRFVDDTIGALQPLPLVIQLDRAQAQTPTDLQAYLRERITPELIARGRDLMTRHQRVLDQIERTYGVQRQFLVAIWGLETGYGQFTGAVPVLQALVTLAWDTRRSAYFRAELFDALQILRDGPVEGHVMTGSWAGALGQPQFMPSSYLEYAVDFDRDGRRDIWTSPADTLGSIANYLQRFGWDADAGWGREVVVPTTARAGIDRALATRPRGCTAMRALTARRPLAEWSERGVRDLSGSELSRPSADASLLTLDNQAFLVSRNYEAILGYNCSHRYALSVAMLADLLE